MSEYPLKVVLGLRGDKGSVGLQAEGCDPLFFPLEEGSLEAALFRLPGLVEEARRRWAESPHHPKHEGPPPSQPAPQPRPAAVAPQRSTAQPPMF